MSGTSVDGIDAVLVEFNGQTCTLLATGFTAYPSALRDQLKAAASEPDGIGLQHLGKLDHATGEIFAQAAIDLLTGAGIAHHEVRAIGSHGQTLLHAPSGKHPFSLQIGSPSVIANRTGITTVADFRSADIAAGGQGAPLAPAFHHWAFSHPAEERAVVNLGGIANITCVKPDEPLIGFDTGPANTLLDHWCQRHQGESFDHEGRWAATGRVQNDLLDALLDDPWFAKPPPKSTGVDYFSAAWLDAKLARLPKYEPAEVQASLAELTAASIAKALGEYSNAKLIAICGGGARNLHLLRRLSTLMPNCRVTTTADWGIPADWVEAAAFAWLAKRRLAGLTSNAPSVTGARKLVSLGAIHAPPQKS